MAIVIRLPKIQAHKASVGAEPVGSTPAQFDVFLKSEIAKYAALIKQSGAKAE
jgi:tripartite-type tricarboxylate transporter receptor subunit TctC